MSLSRAAIDAAADLALVAVSVPEWGGDVFIRPMSGAERDSFDAELVGKTNRMENIRARLGVRVICDDNGIRLYADNEADILGKRSSAALNRIFAVAQRLNGIGAPEATALGNASAGAPSAGSGSDSPSTSG